MGRCSVSTQEYIDRQKRAIKMVSRAAEIHRPGMMYAWLQWLVENTEGYAAEAISCTDCGAIDRPVAMVEGGSTPEYACPLCFAKRQVNENEMENEDSSRRHD